MLDASSPSDAIFLPRLQRAQGALSVSVRRRGAETVLEDFYQQGCLKARLPRIAPGAAREIVALNSSGGIAAGDALAIAYRAGAATQLILANQAAERCYRALPGAAPARLRNRIVLEDAARVEWLAQETILFDGAALDRQLDIAMPASGHFLGVEMLVFGRAAMGETVHRLRLADTIRLVRDGALVLHDAIRFDPARHGDAETAFAGAATLAAGRAMATILLAAPDAEARLAPLRAMLEQAAPDAACQAAASAWNGMLLARFLAADGAALRAAVIAALDLLRDRRALPRVWHC